MTEIEIDGRTVFTERRGEGEPLLLIMGLSGNSTHWGDPFLDALIGAGFEAIMFDNRGLGRSSPAEAGYTIADMATDAVAVLDSHGLETAHVCGISMGGMIAQELVLAFPDRIRTLTLGCTTPGPPLGEFATQKTMDTLMQSTLSGDRALMMQTGWELNVSAAYAAVEENFRAFAAVASQYPAELPVLMAQLQAVMAHNTGERLGAITAPTLVIHGTDDLMLPYANAAKIADAIPGATLETFEGVGHLFFWERPQESARLIAEHAGVVATA